MLASSATRYIKEIEFSIDDVLGAVLKAIEKKMPGFKLEFIEASHSPSKKVIGYEFVGKMEEAELDLEVSADGLGHHCFGSIAWLDNVACC